MSEKILGFKEKDVWDYGKEIIARTLNNEEIVVIQKNKLVPVITIKWLEKWCKENKYNDVQELHTGRGYDSQEVVEVNDLLSAAKKQAGEKK